jgi:hypothetical protein
MKDSTARQGEVTLTPDEQRVVSRLREAAKREPVREGTAPAAKHRTSLAGLDVTFIQWVDEEGESAQYQLHLMGQSGQPSLSKVQAFARLFFDTLDFQIMPDARHPGCVRVLGIFFPCDASQRTSE